MPKKHGLAWTTNPQSSHVDDFQQTPFPEPSGIRRLWPGKARDMPNLQPGWKLSEGPRPTPVSDTCRDGMVQVLLGVAYADGSLKLTPAGKSLRDGFEPPPNHTRFMPVTAIDRPGAPGVHELAIPVSDGSAAFRFLTGEDGLDAQGVAASIWANQVGHLQWVHAPNLAGLMTMPEDPPAPHGKLNGFLCRMDNDRDASPLQLGDGTSSLGAMRDLQDGWRPPGGDHPHDAIVDSRIDASRLVFLGYLSQGVVTLSHAGEKLRRLDTPAGITHVPVLAIPDTRHPDKFDLALSVGPREIGLLTGTGPGHAATPGELARFWEDRRDASDALRVESLRAWQGDPHSNGPRSEARYHGTPAGARTMTPETQREWAAFLASSAGARAAADRTPAHSPRSHSPGP